jgi:hypothetical protein
MAHFGLIIPESIHSGEIDRQQKLKEADAPHVAQIQ